MLDATSHRPATVRPAALGVLPINTMPGNAGRMPATPSASQHPAVRLRRFDDAAMIRIADKPREVAEHSSCTHCHTRGLCMPVALAALDPAVLDGIVGNSRKIERGHAIYRAGDTFRNLYVTRAGSSKTVLMGHNGREQITGFQIVGEFLGMDGITTGKHELDAIALEDSLICAIPFDALEMLSREDQEFQHYLHRLMSREIVRESAHMMLMGTMNAEERVAAFLVNLSRRYQECGYSPTEFYLRMGREEIGCYLGLTLETVSRMLSRLQQRGCIDMSRKQARIIDLEGLSRIWARQG